MIIRRRLPSCDSSELEEAVFVIAVVEVLDTVELVELDDTDEDFVDMDSIALVLIMNTDKFPRFSRSEEHKFGRLKLQ